MILDTRHRRYIDLPLLILTYLLAILGVVVIYSATKGDATAYHKKQIVNLAIGTVGLIIASGFDYHYLKRFVPYLYTLNLFALLIVFKLGKEVKGAARWIKIGSFPFQPSEWAKIIIIITLAAFLASRQEEIEKPKTVFLSFLYISVPLVLILKQPDLTTSMVLFAIWLGMVFMAGAKLKHIGAVLASVGVLAVIYWNSGMMRDYQKARITNIFHAEQNKKGSGYHVTQAKIAIGSGGMWGKGLGKGSQVQGGFVPEEHTDFIFTVVGEELGFAGAVFIVLLYLLLILRGATIVAAANEDIFGKLIGTGILSMLTFHVLVNISMNIGIFPVAGVPLLLLSYGGNNIMLTLVCIGVLQSIVRHRHQLLF